MDVRLIGKRNLCSASHPQITFALPFCLSLTLSCCFCSSFRDRRYEYKGLNKVWKGRLSEAKASGNSIKIQEAQVQKFLHPVEQVEYCHPRMISDQFCFVFAGYGGAL